MTTRDSRRSDAPTTEIKDQLDLPGLRDPSGLRDLPDLKDLLDLTELPDLPDLLDLPGLKDLLDRRDLPDPPGPLAPRVSWVQLDLLGRLAPTVLTPRLITIGYSAPSPTSTMTSGRTISTTLLRLRSWMSTFLVRKTTG